MGFEALRPERPGKGVSDMFKRSLQLSAVACAMWSALAFAQNPTEPAEPKNPPEAGQPTEQPRRPRAMGRAASAEHQLALLTDRLKLDETQRGQIGPLLQSQEALIQELRTKTQPTPEEREALRNIRVQMEEAGRAQDKVRMNELRDQMASMQKTRRERIAPIRAQLEEADKALHDNIYQLLRPEQQEKFEEVWKERRIPPGARRDGPVRNVRALKSIVERLPDLTEEQKAQIKTLFEEFQKSQRERPEGDKPSGDQPGRPDREARQKQAMERMKKLHDDVIAVLTPEQKAKVEETLKGKRARRERPPRDRDDRPGERRDGDEKTPPRQG